MRTFIIGFISLILSSCSTFKCMAPSESFFGFDGKAMSSCQARHQFKKRCEDHGGLRDHNALYGSCRDGLQLERKY